MPYSSRTLPERPVGPWTALAVAASAAPWIAVQGLVWFGPRGRWRWDPIGLLLAVVGIALVSWSLLAWLRLPRRALVRGFKIVGAGVAATLVWVPVLYLASGFLLFAMALLAGGFIPLVLIPLLLWGSFCASWALARSAVTALLDEDTVPR